MKHRNVQRMARVGIEAFLWGQAGTYRQSGVSAYIRHLVRGLAGVPFPGEFLVYLPSSEPLADLPADPRLHARASPFVLQRPSRRILWQHSIFPLLLWQDRVRLLHATMNVAPWWSPCPVVVTVTDLAFRRYPQVHPPGRRLYLGLLTRWTARRARAIIAISEYTRQEVVRLLGVPAERIQVIYLGVDSDFRPLPQDQVESFRRQRGLPDRYFFYLGNLEPRKNLPRLVEAYGRIRDCGVPLVLGGPRGWGYADLFQTVEKLDLAGQVLFPGFVPREELPLWYNAAEALVYPSIYEGFGLPPLEAMACGTPVVASAASSLPEVIGQAGLLVDPQDVAGLAAALRQVLTDQALRGELRRRGLEQARRFTWEKMARETVELYRRLLWEST